MAIFGYEKKFSLPTAKQCHGDSNHATDQFKVITLSNSYGTDDKEQCETAWNKFYDDLQLDPKDKNAAKTRKAEDKAALKKLKSENGIEKKVLAAKLKELKAEAAAAKKKAKYAAMSPAKKATYDAAEVLKQAKVNEKQEAIRLKMEAKAAKKASSNLKDSEKEAAMAAVKKWQASVKKSA